MNDMVIEFDWDGNHYVYEMHEVSGEVLRSYILSNPESDFIACVIFCGELVNMYPIEKEAST